MAVRKTGLATIPEGSTARLTGVLKDESGVVIDVANLTTLTLTLYVKDFPNKIINSREGQSVKNANGGTVDGSGNLTMILSGADNAIVDAGNDTEDHIALFKWSWNSGANFGRKEILLTVDNLDKEP